MKCVKYFSYSIYYRGSSKPRSLSSLSELFPLTLTSRFPTWYFVQNTKCHEDTQLLTCECCRFRSMSNKTTGAVPDGYQTPPFPSLYWPIKSNARFDHPKYLYYSQDVWRFTLFWTIIIFEASHVVASLYAVAVQWRNWKLMWMVPIIYMLVAGVEAVLAGSVVGLM